MSDEREKGWVEGIKKVIKDKTGLELKAETIEELKEELDRISIVVNDYARIVHKVYWLHQDFLSGRRLRDAYRERDGRE